MKTCFLLLLFCLSTSASAEVYRCTQSGAIVYSAEPCDVIPQAIDLYLSGFAGTEPDSAEIYQASDGMYMAPVSVNGIPAEFTVDTDASRTTLNAILVSRMGEYSCISQNDAITPNGLAVPCSIIVSSLTFAGFIFHNVLVNVSRNSSEPSSLGSDLLSSFKIQQKDGAIILSR